MGRKVIIFALVLLLLAGAGLGMVVWLGTLVLRKPVPQIANTPTILLQVQSLSQLVTVKYVLEKVVVLEDVKWYGENRVLLVAHGVVKAGVDLGQIKPGDVTVQGQRVRIAIPRAAITDVYLDEKNTEVVERTTGVMRVFDKTLEQTARRQAVDDLRRAARLNGILKEADERARLQLETFLRQMGYTEVVLTSR